MKNTLRAALVANTLGACASETTTPVRPNEICVRHADETPQLPSDVVYPGAHPHQDWEAISLLVANRIADVTKEHGVQICPDEHAPAQPRSIVVHTTTQGAYGFSGSPVDGPVDHNSRFRIGGERLDLDCTTLVTRPWGVNEPFALDFADGSAFAGEVGDRVDQALQCVLNSSAEH